MDRTRKIFAAAFIEQIVVDPDELEAAVYLKQLPLAEVANGNVSVRLVAGTGAEGEKTRSPAAVAGRIRFIGRNSHVLAFTARQAARPLASRHGVSVTRVAYPERTRLQRYDAREPAASKVDVTEETRS